MSRIAEWWKKDNRYLTMLKAVLMAALPVVCVLVYCGTQGRHLSEVYLPGSEWNDELFYYKQVEGIVHFGFPQGYFGFNESHALKLSFAAWSPVLVFPWIIWGLLFGWNLMSPIICNIVFLSLTMFFFVWLTKPAWKQLGVLTLLFSFFTLFIRFMLSAMPEIICFGMLILFYGVAVNYLERERGWKLGILFGMASVMTLMRPYLLLCLLLPMFLWIRSSKWKGVAGSLGIFALTLTAYALIKHYLGAEYFAPLFFTDWFTTFFTDGIGAGVHHFFGTLYYMGTDFFRHIRLGVLTGLASGAYFFVFLTAGAILILQGWKDLRRGKKNSAVIELHLGLCYVAMLFAILLMYKLTEGSKHLLTFVAAGIFIVSLMETKTYKKAVLLAALFAYFFSYKASGNFYDFGVPFAENDRMAQVNEWQALYDGMMELSEDVPPNFENVVIWVLHDTVEGKNVYMKWQVLYGLPRGFGISCCMPEYVAENMDTLQSRYIATVSGGSIDKLCEDAGYRLWYRDGDVALYER
ncbi:MAG: hypothetical protein K6G30_02250 [Acetatifactor sp.]|nr:hypothetical protein [Acetatifactor sp.]